MALSYVVYAGDGATTNFTYDKGYIQQSDVSVYVDGVLQTITTHYTWFNATTVQFVAAPASAAVIRIERSTTNTARLVDFQDAGNLTEADLDLSADQLFYLAQEGQDDFTDNAMGVDTDDKWDASSKVIKNVTDPTNAQDAATKAYGDANWGGASVTAAQAAQAAAEAAQTAAETAETNAETAETGAVAAQTAAELAYDNFDDRYLGAKAADPALDNDGDALIDGALYFNTTTNGMKVYDLGTTSWLDVLTEGAADLLYQPLDNDLSDIAALTPTKGNLMVGNGTDWVSVGVGTNDYVLTADSTDAEGVVWTAPPQWHFAGNMSTASGSSVTQTINAAATAVKLVFHGVSIDTDNIDIRCRLGTSGAWSTTSAGNINRINDSGGANVLTWGSGYGYFTSDYSIGLSVYGAVEFTIKNGGTDWVAGVNLGADGNQIYTGGGSISVGGTINRVELSPEATGAFNGGSVDVYEYY